MLGVSRPRAADLARCPLRGVPALLHAPFPLKRFLECLLTAPLPLTRFSVRSAHPPLTRSGRLNLCI